MELVSKPRNIYIVGAQCTGKTTLVNALETHLDNSSQASRPAIIREVARSVLEKHSFTAADIRSSPERSLELQRRILSAQVTAEREALKIADYLISDRSGADPICYALCYVGQEGAGSMLLSPEWCELKERMAEALVVVCEAGADWLDDDGVRLMPFDREEWLSFHRLFCRFLDESRLPYAVLFAEITDLDERVNFVLSRS